MPDSSNEYNHIERASRLRPLLDVEDTAAILRLSVKTIHQLVREGKLACVQVTAKERRFTTEQVEDFIQSHSKPGRVDNNSLKTVSSPVKKGGVKSSGVNSRQALLQEMRECR